MNGMRFEAEISPGDAAFVDVVRERVYGAVRVVAGWPEDLTTPAIRVVVEVQGDVDPRDAPAYVELFFHDAFLLLNLASPGSFGGMVSIMGGELRVRELVFDPRVFECASAISLPIGKVSAWYEHQQFGTRQVASDAVMVALFQLLRLGRRDERDDEEESILRLASAAEALLGRPDSLQRLFALRESIAFGRAALFHPMHDDALDPSVEDATREWTEIADLAATAVIGALQARISA
jgi:hypothetical protein